MVALEATRTATESELDSSTFATRLTTAADEVAVAYAQVQSRRRPSHPFHTHPDKHTQPLPPRA